MNYSNTGEGASEAQAPIVRLTKSYSTSKSMGSRGAFFRRFFSGSSTDTTENQAVDERGETVPNGVESLRHKASNIFRKPVPGGGVPSRPSTIGRAIVKRDTSATDNKLFSQYQPEHISRPKHDSALSIVNPTMPAGALNSAYAIVDSLMHENSTRQPFHTLQQGSVCRSTTLTDSTVSTTLESPNGIATSSDHRGDNKDTAPLIPPVPDHITTFGSLELSAPIVLDKPLQFCSPDTSLLEQIHPPATQELVTKHLQEQLDSNSDCLIKALALYEWQDNSMAIEDYAAYIGIDEPFNVKVRETYLELYDFSRMSLLRALRLFCSKLYIKGETQVLDRILESFSRRWRACNKDEMFITSDIAYIISFALITLNTDLHIANVDTDQKMRKSAFVNNTMRAIRASQEQGHSDPIARPPLSHSTSVASTRTEFSDDNTIRFVSRSASSTTLLDSPSTAQPQSRRHDSNEMVTAQSVLDSSPPENIFLQSPPFLSRRSSKRSLQTKDSISLARSKAVYLDDLLQDMYVNVRHEQIRQPQGLQSEFANADHASVRSGLAGKESDTTSIRARSIRAGEANGNNSVLSFDAISERRSPALSTTSTLFGWTPSALYSSPHDSRLSLSSRTSTTTTNNSRTHAPGSQRVLGFAGSLSNVIIREESVVPTDQDDVARIIDEAEEDTLTLFGAPFAKEGRVKYKCQERLASRKSKFKHWSSELFAVLGKGELRLFDFSMKSMKSRQITFGGGDWTQNARTIACIQLIQSMASAVSDADRLKERPYVWRLAMANGDVHHFEVGTEELIGEWVSTANYWAARATKEPLLGAVDNAEYGWGQCIDSLLPELDEVPPISSSSDGRERPTSHFSAYSNGNSSKSRFEENAVQYPGNSIPIREWQPEQAPLMGSTLSQEDQYAALSRFIIKLQAEAERHSSKRNLIQRVFSPGHPNLAKALDNFERRKRYLDQEIAKYKVYIEALRFGIETAQKVQTERENKNLDKL